MDAHSKCVILVVDSEEIEKENGYRQGKFYGKES